MGAGASKADNQPVEGLPEENPLQLIPIYRTSLRERYTLNKKTTLKLKKNSLLSAESDVLDSRGFYVFRKSGSLLTCAMEFRDDAGNILATAEAKTRCSKTVVWIKLGDPMGPVVATLIHNYRGNNSMVSIYIHKESESLLTSEPFNRKPNIQAVGDFSGHQFYLVLDQYKIAQVQRNPEPQLYSLEIGPNTDIAFITICTAVIDLVQLRAKITPLGVLNCCLSPDMEPDEESCDEST